MYIHVYIYMRKRTMEDIVVRHARNESTNVLDIALVYFDSYQICSS